METTLQLKKQVAAKEKHNSHGISFNYGANYVTTPLPLISMTMVVTETNANVVAQISQRDRSALKNWKNQQNKSKIFDKFYKYRKSSLLSQSESPTWAGFINVCVRKIPILGSKYNVVVFTTFFLFFLETLKLCHKFMNLHLNCFCGISQITLLNSDVLQRRQIDATTFSFKVQLFPYFKIQSIQPSLPSLPTNRGLCICHLSKKSFKSESLPKKS